jgi:hypothetical protein
VYTLRLYHDVYAPAAWPRTTSRPSTASPMCSKARRLERATVGGDQALYYKDVTSVETAGKVRSSGVGNWCAPRNPTTSPGATA